MEHYPCPPAKKSKSSAGEAQATKPTPNLESTFAVTPASLLRSNSSGTRSTSSIHTAKGTKVCALVENRARETSIAVIDTAHASVLQVKCNSELWSVNLVKMSLLCLLKGKRWVSGGWPKLGIHPLFFPSCADIFTPLPVNMLCVLPSYL